MLNTAARVTTSHFVTPSSGTRVEGWRWRARSASSRRVDRWSRIDSSHASPTRTRAVRAGSTRPSGPAPGGEGAACPTTRRAATASSSVAGRISTDRSPRCARVATTTSGSMRATPSARRQRAGARGCLRGGPVRPAARSAPDRGRRRRSAGSPWEVHGHEVGQAVEPQPTARAGRPRTARWAFLRVQWACRAARRLAHGVGVGVDAQHESLGMGGRVRNTNRPSPVPRSTVVAACAAATSVS